MAFNLCSSAGVQGVLVRLFLAAGGDEADGGAGPGPVGCACVPVGSAIDEGAVGSGGGSCDAAAAAEVAGGAARDCGSGGGGGAIGATGAAEPTGATGAEGTPDMLDVGGLPNMPAGPGMPSTWGGCCAWVWACIC